MTPKKSDLLHIINKKQGYVCSFQICPETSTDIVKVDLDLHINKQPKEEIKCDTKK